MAGNHESMLLDSPPVSNNEVAVQAQNVGRELAALDFEQLIGGPMVAAIHAQVQSSLATVNFIKTIGFERTPYADITPYMQSTGKPAYIQFEYTKIAADGRPLQAKLSVPFLTMLPIPTLRVESLHIEFLAKINSTVSRSVDQSLGLGLEIAGRLDTYTLMAGMKVTAVYQRQTKEGNLVTRDYSMNVRLKAVQDDMPPGVDRLMQVLEAGIQELDISGRPLKVA